MSTPIATQISIVPGLEWVHFALPKQQREKANQVRRKLVQIVMSTPIATQISIVP